MPRNKAFCFISCLLTAAWLIFNADSQIAFAQRAEKSSIQFEELKAQKIKSLSRRDPKISELVSKVEAKLAKLQQENPHSPTTTRLTNEVESILLSSSNLAEPRFKADIELLEAIVKEHKEPTKTELASLQHRYAEICQQLDDLLLSKDLDRALHIHDKLVRYTALGLWDTEKLSAELEKIESVIANAQDLPYGRSELLASYRNRKLAAVPNLYYIGVYPQEEIYLTNDRRSVGVLEEAASAVMNLEMADHVIQDPDGKLVDLTQINRSTRALPFSPPLSLWLKSRILEGRIPAITLRLIDDSIKAQYAQFPTLSTEPFYTVQDIVSGKLDDYLSRNFLFLSELKYPILVGVLNNFDREAAENAFGADGKTPFYFLIDPKLQSLPANKLQEELEKRFAKGSFISAKISSAELSNQYGDPSIPDGPERIGDAWKHVKDIANKAGGTTISLYSIAGAFHGNKNTGKFHLPKHVGNQSWNKLDYYFPGDDVLDWLGIEAIGSDPISDPKGANILECLSPFMTDQRSSSWQSTPIMLSGLAAKESRVPFDESPWISTVFQKIIPDTFSNVSTIFLSAPNNITLWTRDGMSTFHTSVGSNKLYKWPLRFKVIPAQP